MRPEAANRIDIRAADLRTVRKILREHVPDLDVRAIGSRVSGFARETSDLDLVLMTPEPLEFLRMAELREAFTQSNLPYLVDLVDWASTSPRFRALIDRQYSVIQTGRRSERSPTSV